MPRTSLRPLSLLILVSLIASVLPFQVAQAAPLQHGGGGNKPVAKLPKTEVLGFEENLGQFDPAVRYRAQAYGGQIFFAPDEVVLALPVAERTVEVDLPSKSKAPDVSQPDSGAVVDESNQTPLDTVTEQADNQKKAKRKEAVYAAVRVQFVTLRIPICFCKTTIRSNNVIQA